MRTARRPRGGVLVQPFYPPLEFVAPSPFDFFLPPHRRVSLVLSMNLGIEQLELRLEDLETNQAAADPLPAQLAILAVNEKAVKKPARRPLPAELPREVETIAPKQETCPDCGGTLRPLGEDVSEVLEYVPARFKVIRTVRPKLSCACWHGIHSPRCHHGCHCYGQTMAYSVE